MHPLYPKAHQLSNEVIGAAVEVHRIMGPGLLESIYEKCLMRELSIRGFSVVAQETAKIEYKGVFFAETLRFDLLVEQCLLIEVKAVEKIAPIHKAQLLSYMKTLNVPLGLYKLSPDEISRWRIAPDIERGKHTIMPRDAALHISSLLPFVTFATFC